MTNAGRTHSLHCIVVLASLLVGCVLLMGCSKQEPEWKYTRDPQGQCKVDKNSAKTVEHKWVLTKDASGPCQKCEECGVTLEHDWKEASSGEVRCKRCKVYKGQGKVDR